MRETPNNPKQTSGAPNRAPALFFGLLILYVALVALDQLTKHLAVTHLKGHDPIVLIRGALELQYVENRGAAFGILQNQQWFFWILTAVFLAVSVYLLIRTPKTRRYLPLIIAVLVLAAGALGNLIDRVAHRYVVDFIYISLIKFPVFNVADIYVTLSVILLIVLFLFKYKENELDFLGRKKDKGGAEEEEPTE